jgi:hypothetical protein
MIIEWEYKLLDDTKLYECLLEKGYNVDKHNIKQLIGPNFILFLDTSFDEEVENRLYVQNIARQFQKMRKNAGLNPWDEVKLYVDTKDEKIINVLTENCKLFKEVTNRDINIGKGTTELYKMDIEYNFNEENSKMAFCQQKLDLYLFEN